MAATQVEHGRRRGTSKSMPPLEFTEEKETKGKALVIAHDEWKRITQALSASNREAEERKARSDARKALHETSKAMAKSWDNTIEGQRQKRIAARKLREEKEEAEKIKIDVAEAQYQAERRKEAIQKAKTLLYYQTDRVKSFHGALLVSEVLKEREAQLKMKGAREERVKQINEKYRQFQEKALQQADLDEVAKTQKQKVASDETAKFQLTQITAREQFLKKQREESLAEQAKLEHQAAEYAKKLKELEAENHRRKLAFRERLDKDVLERKELEKRAMADEARLEEENRLYAEGKKKMTQLRKLKETELLQELQRTQEKMAGLLQQQMTKKATDEDERTARVIAEQDAKKAHEEQLKEQRYLEEVCEITRHRAQVMEELEQKKNEQAELDRELLKQRVIQDHKYHAQNMEKQRNRAEAAKLVQHHHQAKMEECRADAQREKAEEKALLEEEHKILELEESQFQEYADKVIEEATARKAPTDVLKKAAALGAGGGHGGFLSSGFVRPSFKVMDVTGEELPSYVPRELLSPSIRKRPVDTQKRMGFTN